MNRQSSPTVDTSPNASSRIGWAPNGALGSGRTSAVWLGGVLILGLAVLELASGRLGFYEDEGLNLLKAWMVEQGHPLYREVFSDQAPMFTWLLSALMGLFGASIVIYRQVALFFGLALLGGVSAVTAEAAGRWAGVLCALLMLLFVPFLKFATTILITTPAAALATWSLFFALRYAATPTHKGLLVVSGLLLGLAGTTKVAMLYFVPIVAAPILLLVPGGDRGGYRRALGVWLGALIVPLVIVAGMIPLSTGSSQMFQSHLAAFDVFREQTSKYRSWILLAPEMVVLYAATLASLFVLVRTRARATAVLGLWLAVVSAWIFNVRPLWLHHVPELVCAMSSCLASGAIIGIRWFRREAAVSGRRRSRRLLFLLPSVLLAAGMIVNLLSYDRWRRWLANTSVANLRAVANALAEETTVNDWVIVDRPIVAFLAKRRVPPFLAMISAKRIGTVLTNHDLVTALDQYKPLVLVLCSGRFDRFDQFHARVEREYESTRRILTPGGVGHASCLFFRRRT